MNMSTFDGIHFRPPPRLEMRIDVNEHSFRPVGVALASVPPSPKETKRIPKPSPLLPMLPSPPPSPPTSMAMVELSDDKLPRSDYLQPPRRRRHYVATNPPFPIRPYRPMRSKPMSVLLGDGI